MAGFVSDGRVRVPDLRVVRVGPYSAGDLQLDHTFLMGSSALTAPLSTDLFGDNARVNSMHLPDARVFSLPHSVARPVGDDVTVETSGSGIPLSTRVDVSRTVHPEDLVLFERSRPAAHYAAPAQDQFN